MNKVPNEAWPGRKPSANHLKIFGSFSYKHIPDAKRRKLEDKSTPLVLLGYHNTRSYRLFDPYTKQVAINRDVIVLESEVWNRNAKDNDATLISASSISKL